MLLMGKSTISMVIFNSYVSHYQRVSSDFLYLSIWRSSTVSFLTSIFGRAYRWHAEILDGHGTKLYGSHGFQRMFDGNLWKPWPKNDPLNVRWVPKILENQWWFLFHILFAIKLVSMAIRKKNMDTTRIPLVDPHRISHVVCLYVCILYI